MPLGEYEIFILLEGAACVLLAASAALRARQNGGQIGGAVALGLFCGLCLPLMREASHLPGFFALVAGRHIPCALGGALAGGLLLSLPWCGRHGDALFFWLDSLSLGLAVCLQCAHLCWGASLEWPHALALGLVFGLVPGLVRDVAAGDAARLLEEDWYAMAAALAAMLCLALLRYGLNAPTGVTAGALLMLALRFWRSRKGLCWQGIAGKGQV
ncbi:TRIC cation channel family protein [Desulfovibrio sp. SGI.169]|uniref:TRIC cation channel family protein n=1 Tax=Desulfovibrio sp. SGI.169 TaxID=3420561 RepID=UPI003CFE869D